MIWRKKCAIGRTLSFVYLCSKASILPRENRNVQFGRLSHSLETIVEPKFCVKNFCWNWKKLFFMQVFTISTKTWMYIRDGKVPHYTFNGLFYWNFCVYALKTAQNLALSYLHISNFQNLGFLKNIVWNVFGGLYFYVQHYGF